MVYKIQFPISNAVRHGRPDCVTLRLEVQDGRLMVEVADDGVGCDSAAAVAAGRGVAQLHQWLQELGGNCQFTNAVGGGTTIRFHVPGKYEPL